MAGGIAGVCVAALVAVGVMVTMPETTEPEEDTATVAAAPDGMPAASIVPDGLVEIVGDREPVPLPDDWAKVRPLLTSAVEDAEELGLDLSFCVMAIDARTSPEVCVGAGTQLYAASVTKLASAVAALEAWGGDPEAETPLGVTIGELVDDSITVSDNDAADELIQLTATGPDAIDTEPFAAINTVTARVGLADSFHSGNYYTEGYWSSDWSHLDAEGSAQYLAELVRAADGNTDPAAAAADDLLTEPSIARFILEAMLRQERTGKIPGLLPEGATANKTGATDTVSHDVAVLNTAGGRLVMSAVSSAEWLGGGPDEIVANAAEQVVDVFGGPREF